MFLRRLRVSAVLLPVPQETDEETRDYADYTDKTGVAPVKLKNLLPGRDSESGGQHQDREDREEWPEGRAIPPRTARVFHPRHLRNPWLDLFLPRPPAEKKNDRRRAFPFRVFRVFRGFSTGQ